MTYPYLATAVCCREWLVDPCSPIGRCGFCHNYPVIDWTLDAPSPAELPDPWAVHDEGWTCPVSDCSVRHESAPLLKPKTEETER